MSHPVEVDYGQAAARQPGRYAPPESLPKDVPLVQGRIECTTCHDPAAPTVMRVVEQPRLCFACHRMGN
jgi:predicted CXXCH cytochrome family protein